jgi:hypothetical protein
MAQLLVRRRSFRKLILGAGMGLPAGGGAGVSASEALLFL